MADEQKRDASAPLEANADLKPLYVTAEAWQAMFDRIVQLEQAMDRVLKHWRYIPHD